MDIEFFQQNYPETMFTLLDILDNHTIKVGFVHLVFSKIQVEYSSSVKLLEHISQDLRLLLL